MESCKDLLLEIFKRTPGVEVYDETPETDWYGYTMDSYCPDRQELKTLLDQATNEEKMKIFIWWLSDENACYSYETQYEIAKSICKDGQLVKTKAEEIIFSLLADDKTYYRFDLRWAFLGSSLEYEDKVIQVLKYSEMDSRDGIFMAALNLNTPKIREAVRDIFANFSHDDWVTSFSTGEIGWAEAFDMISLAPKDIQERADW